MVDYIRYTPDITNNWTSAHKECQKERPWAFARLMDSFTSSQLEGKLWLGNEIQKLDIKLLNIALLGGWYAHYITTILIDNCENILLKKDRIKVGGFQWIYNILYHIALCKEIPTGAPSLTYLNEKQVIELKRYETFIKDIERDGESRNRLIHHDFIKSKVIFERLVIHFKSILEALSILKEYNELD